MRRARQSHQKLERREAMAEPTAEVSRILGHSDLAPLRLDFTQELQGSLEALMIGFREENRRL